MARPARRNTARQALLLAVLVVLALVVGLRQPATWEAGCTLLRRHAPGLLGLDVGIGACELDPLTQTVRLRGVSLFRPGEDVPLFAADLAELRLGALDPFSRRFGVDLVAVQRPRLALDLTGPAAAPDPDAACPLEPLSRLRIARLRVRSAEVRLQLPDGGRVELDGLDLGWRERWGVAEFEAEGRGGWVRPPGGGGGAPELQLGRLALAGNLDWDGAVLELARGEGAVEDVSVRLSGRVEDLCDPRFMLDAQAFLPLRTVSRVAHLTPAAQGHAWTRVSLTGTPAAPRLGLELTATGVSWGRLTPGSLSARAAYHDGELRLEELELPAGAGVARVRGSVRLDDPRLPARLTLEAEQASLARLLEKVGLPHAWVDFPASGTAALAGALLPRPQLEGTLDLRTGPFLLAARPFDAPAQAGRRLLEFARGHVTSRVAILPDRVTFGALQVEAGRSHVAGEATLHYDTARGLSMQARGDLELSDFGHVAGFSWAGRGGMDVQVEGPYGDPRITGALSLRDFTFWDFGLGVVQGRVDYHRRQLTFPALSGQKGRTPYFGRLALGFGDDVHVRGRLELPAGGRTEDLVDVLAGLSSAFGAVQGSLTGRVGGTVEVDGPADRFGGEVRLALEDTRYEGARLGDGGATLRFVDGQALALERLALAGPAGRTWAEGTFTFQSKGLDFRFGGEALALAELVGPERARAAGVSGTLELGGRVEGDGNTPVVTAYLTSPRVRFAERDLGAAHLEARMVGRELQVWGRPFQDATGALRLRARDPYPFDLSLTLALPEIRPLLPAGAIAQGVTGSLAGVVNAQGTLREARRAQVSATLDRLTLSRGDFRAENDGPLVLAWSNGRLELQQAAFRGTNTELSAGGWVGPDAIDLAVRGALDVRLLESLVPGVERTGGRLELTAVAQGPLSAPRLMGSAQLTDARLSLADRPVSVRGLSGRLEFTDQRVLLEELHGSLNDGQLSARGDVRLERLRPRALEVALRLEGVTYRAAEDLPVTASGDLLLAGAPEALLLTGVLDVDRLHYQRGLELETILKGLGRRSVLPQGTERPREFLTLDVRVRLGDVQVDNNLARAQLGGELRLTGTNASPGLLGTVTAAEGSQAFFRNNRFTLQQGTLEFRDRYSIDPVVDLRAQTLVRDHVVRLHAFGRAHQPQVMLSSEPELSEADILSLLTLGFTSGDRDTAATASASLAAEALFSVSGLDRQVQRFLPQNPILRDLTFQIATTYNDALGQVEPTAQLESKFLTEQLKLTMSQPVSGRGTRARAEYRIHNRLSAQAQWDNENTADAFGNLGLELKFSWEVE